MIQSHVVVAMVVTLGTVIYWLQNYIRSNIHHGNNQWTQSAPNANHKPRPQTRRRRSFEATRDIDEVAVGKKASLEFRTNSGLQVTVDKRDILTARVDAIVCTTNCTLQHPLGLSKAIADKAGASLTRDCKEYMSERRGRELDVGEVMHTTSGKLAQNIKVVIHVVGPAAADFENRHLLMTRLIDAFYKCLVYANDTLNMTSLAIPAISSGNNGVDKKLVAEAAHTALMQFDIHVNGRPRSLNEIHFMDVDEDTVKKFIVTFEYLNLARRPRALLGDANGQSQ